MTQSDSLLDEEELDFLLHQVEVEAPDDEDSIDPTGGDETKITIRGDLDNISLADIFQTLSISKMRGILKVFNPLETRLVYFDQGAVRLMHPNRKGTRRIGQRLVRCGALSTTQLRKALIEQKATGAPIGAVLIEMGFLTESDLTAVLNNQLEEDLHNIFVWNSGSFEFYKNKPDDPEVLEEVTRTPGFEVNGILLEAARRRDEWSVILESVGSVHAIPVFAPDVEFPEMSGSTLAVCEAIDNFSTIADVAELTMLGLFTCAKSVCDLKRDGFVTLADPRLTLQLAQEAVRKSDTKRALQLCQNLKQHASELDVELGRCLADVLEKCREPRLSAGILLECARSLIDPDARVEIATRALGVDRHAISVMEFLQAELESEGRQQDPLYLDTLDHLCEALSDDGQDERALNLFQELETFSDDPQSLLGRKAKLLQRAGYLDEALEVLLELRVEYELEYEQGDDDNRRLIRLYEQILKLDPSLRDVARALRTVKLGRAKARLHKIYGGIAVVLLLITAYCVWSWAQTKRRVEQASDLVLAELDALNTERASELLAQAQKAIGPRSEWKELQSQIHTVVLSKNAAAVAKRGTDNQNALNAIADEIQRGDLERAVILYRELLEQPDAAKLVTRMASGQLGRVTTKLEKTLENLKAGIPDAPAPVSRYDDLKAGATILDQKTKIATDLARTLLIVAEDKTLKKLWPEKDLSKAIALAVAIQTTAQTVAVRNLEYIKLIEKIEKNRRLDPVYREAQAAEKALDFAKAEQLYRQLLEEFQGNESLAPTFRDRVAKYAAINKHLELLGEASKSADFAQARAYYRHLRTSYKDYKWDEMIRLPLKIVSTPPGAEVWVNGESIGKAPLIASYRPADKNRIQIRLDGFSPEQTSITGDSVGVVRSTLNRLPNSSITTKGAVDKAAASGPDDTVFLVDRTGTITAWSSKERKSLWLHETGDLSGLLTRPVVHENLVIVASLDGTLRALDAESGKMVWREDKLPCESRPIIKYSVLVLASEKNLIFIDLRDRKRVRTIELKSEVRQDLIETGGYVVVLDDNGLLRSIRIKNGVDRWEAIQIDDGVPCQPMVFGNTGVFATDEGHVAAYDIVRGRRLWHRSNLGELRHRPASDGKFVFVTAPPIADQPARVHSLDLSTGVPGPTFTAATNELWSTAPVVMGTKLVIGTRDRVFKVFDCADLSLQYHVRGEHPASAPPAQLANGQALFGFESQTLVLDGF